ncbi:MAG: RDD family protein [Flavobacteriaceae bacterium]
MKRLQINTTQNVNINFSLASELQRIGAFAIDNILKFAYLYFIYQLITVADIDAMTNDSWSATSVHILISLPVTFYSLYLEILMNGQTLGKKALNIKVVNIDGFKPSITDYVIRWFLRIVDFNLFFILAVYAYALGWDRYIWLIMLLFLIGKCIGIISIAVSKKNQRIGDMSANTVVIYLKDTAKFSQTILEEITDTYVPKYPNVITLSDNDARIIKDTFSVAAKSKDYATLIKLRNKIEEVAKIKSDEKSDLIFIDKVLKDYNYYTQNM